MMTMEIPRDSDKILGIVYSTGPFSVIWTGVISFFARIEQVGMIKLETARSSSILTICASDTLKYCSVRFQPPKRKLNPVVSSKLDKMVPRRESFKTLIWRETRRSIDNVS
jgi:hypothetical protein